MCIRYVMFLTFLQHLPKLAVGPGGVGANKRYIVDYFSSCYCKEWYDSWVVGRGDLEKGIRFNSDPAS